MINPPFPLLCPLKMNLDGDEIIFGAIKCRLKTPNDKAFGTGYLSCVRSAETSALLGLLRCALDSLARLGIARWSYDAAYPRISPFLSARVGALLLLVVLSDSFILPVTRSALAPAGAYLQVTVSFSPPLKPSARTK